MIRISRIALPLALLSGLAISLFGCSKPAPETPAPSGQDAATGLKPVDPSEQEVRNSFTLIDACNIELLDPNSVEWNTKWDPAFSRDAGQHPSGVRSAHWATEEELADLQAGNQAFPLELSCGSDAGSEYSILIEMMAMGSSLTDMPRQTGSYPIIATSAAGKVPGGMVVRNLVFNGATFQAQEGNLTIERFDAEGVAGNFTINGQEVGGENRPIRVEGTFDMPCRHGSLQTACQSEKAERE
jgi:hypothetical protein